MAVTLREILVSGALGDSISLIRKGFSRRPIISRLAMDFPAASADQLQQVYQFAAECVAAADVVTNFPPGKIPNSSVFPRLPR